MGETAPTEITTIEMSFLLIRYLNNNSDYINIYLCFFFTPMINNEENNYCSLITMYNNNGRQINSTCLEDSMVL